VQRILRARIAEAGPDLHGKLASKTKTVRPERSRGAALPCSRKAILRQAQDERMFG
jgi:hypothetical protein